jgi:hypothetical protein
VRLLFAPGVVAMQLSGNPKITNASFAVLVEHDVRGSNVAVD